MYVKYFGQQGVVFKVLYKYIWFDIENAFNRDRVCWFVV